MKERFARPRQQASELNVEIQSLEAQLVAIENYYRVSRSEQKIRPEDIQRAGARHAHARSRSCAACTTSCARRSPTPRRDATAAGGIGEVERETTKKLSATLQREIDDREAARWRA